MHPRLALTVTWVAIDEVSLAWSFRYLVGSDDRVYGLSEARGLRAGVRRPDDERALLEALELDELQRSMLCRSHRDDEPPVEHQTFNGMDAVTFAEEVLPGLVEAGHVEIEEIGGRPDYQAARIRAGDPLRRPRRRGRGRSRLISSTSGPTGWTSRSSSPSTGRLWRCRICSPR